MLTVYSTPTLRAPALLCGFGGWADAASAATGALRYLLLKRQGQIIARFDPDAVYNYTTTRPLTLMDPRGERRLEWPDLQWSAIEVPESDSDLVVLIGPEPDLRWRECVGAALDFAGKLGISKLVTFGAFLAQVHFAGPPNLLGISSDPRMRAQMQRLGLEQSNYQGPTGFVTALLRGATDRGIAAASVWVAAPSYLSSTTNPKLASALLRVAERLVGQELWRTELEVAGRDMERRIEDALKARPDLASLLRKLEGGEETEEHAAPEDLSLEIEPSASEPDLPIPQEQLPTPEEVLRDLEEHLRRIKGEGGEGNRES